MNNDSIVMHDELFSRRGLSLDRLRTLCAVAEHGGISKAAAGDPIKQSQFSRQLGELGQFFEVELTRRRGKGIELTLSGKELAALSREILGALGDFRQGLVGGVTTIRIGAGESLIQWILLPHIKRLQAELPTVLFSMRNLRGAEIISQLGESLLDFGLVAEDKLPVGIEATKLGILKYQIFVAARTKAAFGIKDWRSALALPLVGLEGEGRLMQKVKRAAEMQELCAKPIVLCSSLPGAAVALKQLDGFAILPEVARQDDLVAIEAPFLREFDRSICFAWNPKRLNIRNDLGRWRKKICTAIRW